MKPESLLGLSLELVSILAAPGQLPADARMGRFFRSRRFIGSHERRFIAEAAYAWLRHVFRARARWRAWLEAAGDEEDPRTEAPGESRLPELREAGFTPRPASGNSQAPARRGLEFLPDIVSIARDTLFPWSVEETLRAATELRARHSAPSTAGPERKEPGRDAAGPSVPGPAASVDRAGQSKGSGGTCRGAAALLEALLAEPGRAGDLLPDDAWPADALERLAAECSLPTWLAARLVEELGAQEMRRRAADLLRPAMVDLRVRGAAADREAVRRSLAQELGCLVQPTPWSPLGLRIQGRTSLGATEAARKHLFEVEDEGSQIVALALDAPRDGIVIDACAGAGGKTLALVDLLQPGAGMAGGASSGTSEQRAAPRIVASDISRERLRRLQHRALAAGVGGRIQIVPAAPHGALPHSIPDADLVLVDAPCSGLGTLRRNPELKLRHWPHDIMEFAVLQRSILERWACRVKRGGRLAYATCSILRQENEEVVDAFTLARPEFKPVESRWARAHLPSECIEDGHVRVGPSSTGTDAFFLALWERT